MKQREGRKDLPMGWWLEIMDTGDRIELWIKDGLGVRGRMVMVETKIPTLGKIWEMEYIIGGGGYGSMLYEVGLEIVGGRGMGMILDRTGVSESGKEMVRRYSGVVRSGELPKWWIRGEGWDREEYLNRYYWKDGNEVLRRLMDNGQVKEVG